MGANNDEKPKTESDPSTADELDEEEDDDAAMTGTDATTGMTDGNGNACRRCDTNAADEEDDEVEVTTAIVEDDTVDMAEVVMTVSAPEDKVECVEV